MHKIFFIFTLLFLISLTGCKNENKIQQISGGFPSTVEQKLATQQSGKNVFEKKNFSIDEIKFSLKIPKESQIGDYTKISRSLSVTGGENDHLLIITVKGLGKNKFADIKNEIIKGDKDVKTTIIPWREKGYEIRFKRPDIKKDYMLIINRTFLLPFKNNYFVLNETTGSQEDNSLSEEIKEIVDSLNIY